MPKNKKPEWAPQNAGNEFAGTIVPGINKNNKEIATTISKKPIKSKQTNLEINNYIEGIKSCNRSILARAITLIESNSPKHLSLAQSILTGILQDTGKSIRIGITGAPGAGKSTFIDELGSYLCEKNYKVAVLAVDPSSSRSKGSILGDKTRMEKLSQNENAFIRPSPSRGTLGGVARKTRETILLTEAAGFNVILIETIGVGQSEILVRSMVDFLLLILLPGGGDELQGIKKGAVELADAIVINKADGSQLQTAISTQTDYKNAVHYLMPATDGWTTSVLTCSAIEGRGIEEIWNNISDFENITKKSGMFEKRRNEQMLDWFYSMLDENIKNTFYHQPVISKTLPSIEKLLLTREITPVSAVFDINKLWEMNI